MAPPTSGNTWVVFCLYSKERVTKNQQKLEALLQILLKNRVEGIILVDNSQHDLESYITLYKNLSSKIYTLKGSNTYGEFSAWVEGMEKVKSEYGAKSFILFNDTVFSHFKLFYWKIINFLWQIRYYSHYDKPVQLGEKVNLPCRSTVMGMSHQHFIRSAFFYLNQPASELFISGCHDVFELAESAFVTESSFELLSHFFSESGAYYVGSWLFSGGWYGSKPYKDFDRRILELKVTAIACEHLASANCLEHGGNAADSNLQRNFKVTEQLSLFWSFIVKHPLFTLAMLRKLRS